MTDYRRIHAPGATWFLTVNLAERRRNRLVVEKIDLLRASFRYVKGNSAWMPESDSNDALRSSAHPTVWYRPLAAQR